MTGMARRGDRLCRTAYRLRRVCDARDAALYRRVLAGTYEALGFPPDVCAPRPHSQRYLVSYGRQAAGIFSLTPVCAADFPAGRWLPPRLRRARARWLEVNNVVVVPAFRATVVLGMMLYESARRAQAQDCDALVGLVRAQVLPFFVDVGVMPVDHPPLHLLGRADLHDFLIYQDTRDPAVRQYLRLRARQWFEQQRVMHRIRQRCRSAARMVAPCSP